MTHNVIRVSGVQHSDLIYTLWNDHHDNSNYHLSSFKVITGSSLLTQQVKDPAFSLLWIELLLWCRSDLWPRNFRMLWAHSPQNCNNLITFFGGGVQKFPGQALNSYHCSNSSHSSDNARSLTTRPPGNSQQYYWLYSLFCVMFLCLILLLEVCAS